MLRLENISISYGPIQAVQDIDITVPKGSIVALIGPNGSGKSTILKSISGLTNVNGGKIWLDDKEITKIPIERRVKMGIAQVLEGRRIFRGLKVEENLELAIAFRIKVTKQERKNRIEEVYEKFPILKEKRNVITGTLSGGQLQTLIFASATIVNPKLLLLDEPSLGLAPLMVKEIYGITEQLNQLGVTVLLAEQMAALALDVADYAYILERGRIMHHGTVTDLVNEFGKEGLASAYLGNG